MRPKVKKFLIWLVPVLAVIGLLLTWSVDRWLESNPGKAKLEAELEEALGMPVRLQGEFSVSLWPTPGVSGSELQVGFPGDEGLLLRCESYHASVALWPLLQGDLRILAVRATGGEFDAFRMKHKDASEPGDSHQSIRLPQIDLLRLERFRVPLNRTGTTTLELHQLELDHFQANAKTPLALDFSIVTPAGTMARVEVRSELQVGDRAERAVIELIDMNVQAGQWRWDDVRGSLAWERAENRFESGLSGLSDGWGELEFSMDFSVGSGEGTTRALLNHQAHDGNAGVGISFATVDGGLEFSEILLEVAEQQVEGEGCFVTAGDPTLYLDLVGGVLDLDQLQVWMPAGDTTGPGQPDLPVDLNIRLVAEEVLTRGVTAYGVELGTGSVPQCDFQPD